MELVLNFTHEDIGLVHRYIKSILSDGKLDGVSKIGTDKLLLNFITPPSISEINTLESLDVEDIVEPPLAEPTVEETTQNIIKNALVFSQQLLIEYAAENIAMGITQAGKTKLVADYLIDLTRYLQTGSLYEVINEIDYLILNGIPENLSPYITEERLTLFKQKIVDYLS